MAPPSDYRTVYLDTCAIVRHLTREDGGEVVSRIVDAADRGDLEIYTSPLLLVEALGQPSGSSYNPQIEAYATAFLDSPRLVAVEFSREVALAARDLHRDEKLETCDAIHLASAIVAGVDVFFTFDLSDFTAGQWAHGPWIDAPFLPARLVEPDGMFDAAGDPIDF